MKIVHGYGLQEHCRVRGLLASGLGAFMLVSPARATELPRDPEDLVATIRKAIENRDYERFKKLVFWKHAGKIKRRIVRFQIRRGLGRPIRSISFEDFPKDGLAGVEATGKLVANMPVTNRVRVVYDESPISDSGKLPTSVFLVGKLDDVYRIGLVVRKPGWDDDDD